MTIIEAIVEILKEAQDSLSSQEIYDKIIEANLYQFKAQIPAQVVNQTIRRHCLGLEFPSARPVKYFQIDDSSKHAKYSLLGKNAQFLAALEEKEPKSQKIIIEKPSEDLLPEELVMRAYSQHIEAVQQQLLEEILINDFVFFEKMVVDLLIQLGYGYDHMAGIVTGKTRDGGIDGIIYEDRLGLDKIYIQAKRYGVKNSVGRKELQAFIGAMENVQKGVFITTSTFTQNASSFVEKQQQKSIRLIDGKLLTELMIRYSVGLVEIKSLSIFKVDRDYFLP